jgi:signal transduction histidine kinase
MRERAKRISAKLNIHSRAGEGTQIALEVPLK